MNQAGTSIRLTQTSAPVGTRGTLGHPANRCFVVKAPEGWFYEHSGKIVDDENFRAGWDLVSLPAAESASA